MSKPRARAIYLLFSTGSSNEDYNGEANYALVPITLKYARWLMGLVGKAMKLKKADSSFHRIGYFDFTPQFFRTFKEADEAESDLDERVSGGEMVILDEPPTIKEEDHVRMECHMVHVSKRDIFWEATVKHTNARIDAYCLTVAQLRDIVTRLRRR